MKTLYEYAICIEGNYEEVFVKGVVLASTAHKAIQKIFKYYTEAKNYDIRISDIIVCNSNEFPPDLIETY